MNYGHVRIDVEFLFQVVLGKRVLGSMGTGIDLIDHTPSSSNYVSALQCLWGLGKRIDKEGYDKVSSRVFHLCLQYIL